jgi:hypothetical protein
VEYMQEGNVHERCGVIYVGPAEAKAFADVVKKQRKEKKRSARLAMARAMAKVNDDLSVLLGSSSIGSTKDLVVAAGAAAVIAVAIVGATQIVFSLLARSRR